MQHAEALDLVCCQSGLFVLIVCRVVRPLLFDERLEEIQEIALLLPLCLLAYFRRRSLRVFVHAVGRFLEYIRQQIQLE